MINNKNWAEAAAKAHEIDGANGTSAMIIRAALGRGSDQAPGLTPVPRDQWKRHVVAAQKTVPQA